MSFINQALRGAPQDYTVELLSKFQDVTKEDVLRALKEFFLPLFDPSSSIAIVVTAPSKSEEIGAGLQTLGFEVSQRELAVEPEELEGSVTELETDSESDSDASYK